MNCKENMPILLVATAIGAMTVTTSVVTWLSIKLGRTVHSVNKVLVPKVEETLSELKDTIALIRQEFNDNIAPKLSQTLENTAVISGDLKTVLPEITPRIKSILDNDAETLVRSLHRLISHTDDVIDNLNITTYGNKLYKVAGNAVDDVEEAVVGTGKSVARLFRGVGNKLHIPGCGKPETKHQHLQDSSLGTPHDDEQNGLGASRRLDNSQRQPDVRGAPAAADVAR